MNHKREALWVFKRCTLYILYTLVFSNSLHLMIGSNLTLIQNGLQVPKCCHAHSKVFFLMFRVSKKCHQDFNILHTYYTCYISNFWVKSGKKWFTYIVFSPWWCLCNQCGNMRMFFGIVNAMTSHYGLFPFNFQIWNPKCI